MEEQQREGGGRGESGGDLSAAEEALEAVGLEVQRLVRLLLPRTAHHTHHYPDTPSPTRQNPLQQSG
eukprot:466641-Rhodomonas_salina.1